MKNRLILSNFLYLTSVLSLLLCLGCGDAEDEQEATDPTNNTVLGELDEPSLQPAEQQRWLTGEDRRKLRDAEKWVHLTVEDWVNLKDRDWEKLKGKDWDGLTNAEVRKLMNLEIPKGWAAQEKDEALREKFSIAARFQKFGDIPQLRYQVEFRRKYYTGKGGFRIVTSEFAKHLVGYSAATYFLFPTEAHRRLLEDDIKQLKSIVAKEERRFMEQLRIEAPETWIKDMRTFLINKHGDIPEVDTVVNFLRKLELNIPRTDEECFAYLRIHSELYLFADSATSSIYESYALLEASHQLRHIIGDPPRQTGALEKYRAARAAGLSFYNIKWGDD